LFETGGTDECPLGVDTGELFGAKEGLPKWGLNDGALLNVSEDAALGVSLGASLRRETGEATG
jgi:hypothetical protein